MANEYVPRLEDEQARRWALIEMGVIDIQSQPEEIRAVGINPDDYTLLPVDAGEEP